MNHQKKSNSTAERKSNLRSLASLFLLMAAMGCENVQRSMVFTTGTTLGVELSIKPESDAPVNIVIGFKRAEVLFDPIMEDKDTANNGDPDKRRVYDIKDKAHSVIAKLLGEAVGTGGNAQTNAKVAVAQWFASGDAAEILARHPGIVATLTNDPAAVAQAVSTSFASKLEANELRDAMNLVNPLYDALNEMKSRDPKALEYVNAIDKLAELAPESFTTYRWDGDTLTAEAIPDDDDKPTWRKNFKTVIQYDAALVASVAVLTDEKIKGNFNYKPLGVGESKPATESDKKTLSEVLALLKPRQQEVRKAWTTNASLVGGIKYYFSQLFK